MDKQRKTNVWVKKRHRRVFAFLRVIFRPFCKLRYRFTAVRSDLPGAPYLILSNHQTTMDPFLMSLSFKFPIYFMASDDIFNLKVSPLIKYLVAPIPKSKSYKDIVTIKNVFRILKEGGAVGIFPEGNRTISGGQWEITEAVAKLAKAAKAPLVLYNLCGGYGTDPRWGRGIRKGKFKGFVKRVLTPEELKTIPQDELLEIIKSELKVDDVLSGISFKSRKRAEFIERALYICPKCGAVSPFKSRGRQFKCGCCGLTSSYTEDLHISPAVECGGMRFDRIYDWFEWERKEIAQRVYGGEAVSDEKILFRESVKFKKKKKLDGDSVKMDAEKLTVTGKKGTYEYPLDEIDAITMVGKKKFNFYYGDKILQVKGDKRFCAIKYVHVFDGLKLLKQHSY